jgi:hypothetical protein
MDKIADQPQKSSSDVAYAVVKAATSAVPVVGGPAAELLGLIFGPPLEKRKEAWLNLLAGAVETIRETVAELTPEKLSQNEAFISTALHATEVAIRTHEQEKLEALRNAVVNTVLPQAPDESLQQIFLDYIDEFTPWHLRILAFFDAPVEWARAQGIVLPDPHWYAGSPSQALEKAMPELVNRRQFYDVVVAGLENRKLLGGGIHGMSTVQGMIAQRTSPHGREFISFITER